MSEALRHAELKQALAAKLAGLASGSGDQLHGPTVVRGPVSVRHYSLLFYGECPAFPTPVAVKYYPGGEGADLAVAVRQFSAMQRAYTAMRNDTNFSVPRPYMLDEAQRLLICEWIEGQPMTDRVLSWRCPLAEAKALMRTAGAWLRRFHHAHELLPAPPDVESALAGVEELRRSRLGMEPFVGQALNRLAATADRVRSIALPRSWIHGDFKTDNLLVAGRRTVGIDTHLVHENVVTYDIAPFLNHLELTCYHPRGLRQIWWREQLVEEFLAGYDFDSRAHAVSLLWTRLYSLFGAWSEFETRAGRHPRHVILRSCFRRLTQRLSDQLESHVAATTPGSPA